MASPKTHKAPRPAGAQFLKRLGEDDIVEQYEEIEDELDTASTLVPVVCLYQGPTVRFEIANRKYKMKFGDVAQIEMAYGTPIQVRPNTDPLPSVIERITNRKVLPVQDPRVDKDKEGTPVVTIQAQRDAAARKATLEKQAQAVT